MPSIKGLLDKYIYHREPEAPPPITTGTAALLLILYTVAYVAPFYLSSRTRPSPSLSRDAPSVIRARIASVTLTCAACSASTFYILTSAGHAPSRDAAHLMGYWPAGLAETASAALLTAALFAGPLFEHLVVHAGWRDWLSLSPLRELFAEWTTWRNIVAGPVTEELLFRSAAVPLMLLAHTSIAGTVLLSPVIFGLAHVHHFYEFRVTHARVPVAAAVARSLLQLAYTTLFGAYATFLFLRTGSLLAICVVHAFCNCMGLPRLWGRVQPDRGSILLWTVAYYALLVTGAATWYRNLWALTASPSALVPIEQW